jgi:hypothetical protein
MTAQPRSQERQPKLHQTRHHVNYLIDIDNAVIVDVEATPARTYDEVVATKTMIHRTERCFALKPKRLAADTAYGTGKFLGWLVNDKKITPHIPVWDMSMRSDGMFSRPDFRWNKSRGIYTCPAGKVLRTSGTAHGGKTLLYRACKRDSEVCSLKIQCCPEEPSRKIPLPLRTESEDAKTARNSAANSICP